MKTLDDIHRQLSTGKFEFSRHAFKRVVERNISDVEIQQAGAHAQSLKIILKISMHPAVSCLDSPKRAVPYISRSSTSTLIS